MILPTLIEHAYDLFSRYTISSQLDVCKICCITDEEEQLLIKTPLKELTELQLTNYICSARCYSEKEQQEMCYYLPRILELVSENIFPTNLTETLFDRLFSKDDNIFIGAVEEYLFLNNFFLHYWIDYINHYPQNEPVEDIIAMIARHFDIIPLLHQWEKSKSIAAIMHFVEFITEKDRNIQIGSYNNPKLEEIIDTWLKNERIRKHFIAEIEDIYYEGKYIGIKSYRFNNDYWLKVAIESAYRIYNDYK